MSYRATAAALAVRAPSASAKLVLAVLATYANEEGACWPSQSRVAGDCQLGLRTVRDAYRALEGAGLIAVEARRRANGSHSTALVRLRFLGPGASGQGQGAPVGRRRRAPQPEASLAGPEPVTEPITEPPMEDAREAGRDRVEETRFDEAWTGWPEAGRATSSRREALAAWTAEVRSGADAAAMAAAARAYAADPSKWGRSGSPLSFHNFYARGRWEAFAASPGGGGSAPAPTAGAFDGPADLAEALRGRLGAAGFASWTAGARWREADRTLVVRTGTAARTVAGRCGDALKALAVRVEGPDR